MRIISVDFDVTDQLLIRYTAFIRMEKKGEYNGTVHQFLTDSKNDYDSDRTEVVYNILIDFGTPMELVRLIKMCI
jgi:hypothetical protein